MIQGIWAINYLQGNLVAFDFMRLSVFLLIIDTLQCTRLGFNFVFQFKNFDLTMFVFSAKKLMFISFFHFSKSKKTNLC
jgi:hypothetical protein